MNKKVYYIFTVNEDGTATKQPVEKKTLKAAILWIKARATDIALGEIKTNAYVVELTYNADGATAKKIYEYKNY